MSTDPYIPTERHPDPQNVGSSGGDGGTVQILTGAFANPNGNVTPADVTKAAIYYPTGGGTTWQWDTVGLSWV